MTTKRELLDQSAASTTRPTKRNLSEAGRTLATSARSTKLAVPPAAAKEAAAKPKGRVPSLIERTGVAAATLLNPERPPDLVKGTSMTLEEFARVWHRVYSEEEELNLASSLANIDAILDRLDKGIAAEHVAMDRLLQRILSPEPSRTGT